MNIELWKYCGFIDPSVFSRHRVAYNLVTSMGCEDSIKRQTGRTTKALLNATSKCLFEEDVNITFLSHESWAAKSAARIFEQLLTKVLNSSFPNDFRMIVEIENNTAYHKTISITKEDKKYSNIISFWHHRSYKTHKIEKKYLKSYESGLRISKDQILFIDNAVTDTLFRASK